MDTKVSEEMSRQANIEDTPSVQAVEQKEPITASEIIHTIKEAMTDRESQWVLYPIGGALAAILALYLVAPGFLAGLVLGLVTIIAAQIAGVWFIWEKVRANREGESQEKSAEVLTPDAAKASAVLERQGSASFEGWVWVATRPPASEWPKTPQRGGRGVQSAPGWTPLKRQAKLHFNMLMLGGLDGEKDIIKLDGCDVRAVSASGGPERKWSKKFPISIVHPERTLFLNSRELLIYCGSGFEKESWCSSLRHAAKLHTPENPSVFKMREDYSSLLELVRQMAAGGEEQLASDPHGKETGNSSIGKWRAKLKRRSKGRFASWGSAEDLGGGVANSPGWKPTSPPRKENSDTEESAKREGGESGSRASRVRSLLAGRKLTFGRKKHSKDVGERSQGSSMGESVMSEDDVSDAGGVLSGDDFSGGEDSGRKIVGGMDGLTSGAGEEGGDLMDGKVEGDTIIRFGKKGVTHQEDEHTCEVDGGIRFCNVMFARFFFDMARNVQVAEMIKGRIERKLARVETPSFMGSLKCTHFELGSKPPLARAMRVLPSNQPSGGVTTEVDFEYRGGAKLTFETRLDMRAYANQGLFKNIDKPGGKADELGQNAELVAAGLATKGLESGGEVLDALGGGPGKPHGRRLKGNFHTAMNNVLARLKPVVQHVTEQVSMVPLTLTVTVLALDGTARLRVGPPPTDRLWFGFSEMPNLELESRPSVGQLNITRNPLAAWMVEKLRNLLRESLVAPQSEDISIPYMITDPDELYQGDPPPAWKRTASDPAPPVATSFATSPKQAPREIAPPGATSLGVSPKPGSADIDVFHQSGSPAGLPKPSSPAPRNGGALEDVFAKRGAIGGTYSEGGVEESLGHFGLSAPLTIPASALSPGSLTESPQSTTSSNAGSPFPVVESTSFGVPRETEFSKVETPGQEVMRSAGGIGQEHAANSRARDPTINEVGGGGMVAAETGLGNENGKGDRQSLLVFRNGPYGKSGSSSGRVDEEGGHLAAIGEVNESALSRDNALGGGNRVMNPEGANSERSDRVGVPSDVSKHQQASAGISTSRDARDPFPSVDANKFVNPALNPSPTEAPLDPWDLVAQGTTPLPKPAVPEAFRNGSPMQSEALSPNSRHEGFLEDKEGFSGSERSFGSMDSDAERADMGPGNRKAMLLGVGKKLGQSVRERGRKYLEKGRLGTLLNRTEGGADE